MKASRRFILIATGLVFLGATPLRLTAFGSVFYHWSEPPIPLLPSGSPSFYDLDVEFNGIADFRFNFGQVVFSVQPLGQNRVVAGWVSPPYYLSYAAAITGLTGWFEIGPSLRPGYTWVDQTLGECWLSAYFGNQSEGFFAGQWAWMGIEFRNGPDTHYGAVWINNSAPIPGGYIRAWGFEEVPGDPVFVVPEPSTWSLLAAGLGAWWFVRMRPRPRKSSLQFQNRQ